jgi:hypothetical protein
VETRRPTVVYRAQVAEQLDTATRLSELALKVSQFLPENLIVARNELDLPIDPVEYRRLYSEHRNRCSARCTTSLSAFEIRRGANRRSPCHRRRHRCWINEGIGRPTRSCSNGSDEERALRPLDEQISRARHGIERPEPGLCGLCLLRRWHRTSCPSAAFHCRIVLLPAPTRSPCR